MASKLNIPSLDFKVELTPAPAAAAMKSAEAKKGDIYDVPITNIKVLPDFNVRVRDTEDYKAGIAALKDSIVANGFYRHKPLAGYVAKEGDATVIYIEDGHRRLEAVEAANFELGGDAQITALPVIVAPQATTMEDMLVNLVQSNSGKDLTPFEKGVVVKRLLNFGMDKKTVAGRLGFTPRYIDDLLVLVGAPAAVRNLMLNNKVSSTQALRELRKDPAKAGERLTAAVKSAEASGKTKATAKDTKRAAGSTGPAMQTIAIQVNFGAGDVMGAVLKAVAAQVRENVPHDSGEADTINVGGSIAINLSIPKPEAPAPAAAAKAPAKAKSVGKGAAAKKTADAAKAAGLVPAGEKDLIGHAVGGDKPSSDNSGVEDL